MDLDTEDQPDAKPAEGLRHANTVTETTVFAPEYYCLDYRAAGLTPENWFARNAGMVDTDTGDGRSRRRGTRGGTPAGTGRARRGRKA